MPKKAPQTQYRPLPVEPWGSRLKRARQTAPKPYRVSQKKAAQFIGIVTMTAPDDSTISRLEQLTEVPRDRRRRLTAWLLCTYYKVNPADLDLGPDDGPEPSRRDEVAHLSTIWYASRQEASADAGRLLKVA